MKSDYDIVVIGAGRVGQAVAEGLIRKTKRVALVGLRNEPEDYFYRVVSLLSTDRVDTTFSLGERKAALLGKAPSLLHIFENSTVCRFEAPRRLRVDDRLLSAKHFVVASGVEPRQPAGQGFPLPEHATPLAVLHREPLVRHIAVLGAGPIGVTTAFRLLERGCSVTLIGNKTRILPQEDPSVQDAVTKRLQEKGCQIVTGAHAVQVPEHSPTKVSLAIQTDNASQVITAGDLVVATGFIPYTKDFHLSTADVYVNENGAVVVNEDMRTSSPWVWAAGSVTGAPFRLSLELHQAELVSNNVTAPFFAQAKLESAPLPSTLPLDPPFARLGLTEEEAVHQFRDVLAFRSDLKNNPRAAVADGTPGFIKLIGRKHGGQLLGVHIINAHAEELILPFDLVMRAGISLFELNERQHWPELTYGETVGQAIRDWIKLASR